MILNQKGQSRLKTYFLLHEHLTSISIDSDPFGSSDLNQDGVQDLVEKWTTKTNKGKSVEQKMYLFDGSSFKMKK